MKRLLIPFLIFTALVTMVQARSMPTFRVTGKVLRIEEGSNGGARLLIESIGENSQNLGKFVANVFKATVINEQSMCQPPQPAKVTDVKVGSIVTVTFNMVFETIPLQVDASRLTIKGYPYAPPKPVPIPQVTIRGRITSITMHPGLARIGTGSLVLTGKASDLLGYDKVIINVTQSTKIYVPGPNCGPIQAQINQLQIGTFASVSFSGPVFETLPPQVYAEKVNAGFRGR